MSRRIENETRQLWGASYATVRLMVTLLPHFLVGGLVWFGGVTALDVLDGTVEPEHTEAAETGLFALWTTPLAVSTVALISYAVTRWIYNTRVSRLPKSTKH